MSLPNDPRCGTYAGAVQHKKRREKPCDQCATAVAAYAAARRFRIGQFHDPDRCRDCGSVFITDHNCPLDAR